MLIRATEIKILKARLKMMFLCFWQRLMMVGGRLAWVEQTR